MKQLLVIGGKLALICAVAALALGFVNSFTAPRIAEIQWERLQEALAKVSFDGLQPGEQVNIEEHPSVEHWYPLGDPAAPSGFIVKLVASGYAGDMGLLASFDATGTVRNAVLMENQETPGLGKEAENEGYMDKYLGKGADVPIPFRKNQLSQTDVDGVTGATITFAGIGKALAEGSAFIQGGLR